MIKFIRFICNVVHLIDSFDKIHLIKFIWWKRFDKIDLIKLIWFNWFDSIDMIQLIWLNWFDGIDLIQLIFYEFQIAQYKNWKINNIHNNAPMSLNFLQTLFCICKEACKKWGAWLYGFKCHVHRSDTYLSPSTLNWMCDSLFKFHIWILEQF